MLGREVLRGKGFSVLLLGGRVGCFMWLSAVGKERDDGLSSLCISGATGWVLGRSIMPVIDAKGSSAPCSDATKTCDSRVRSLSLFMVIVLAPSLL